METFERFCITFAANSICASLKFLLSQVSDICLLYFHFLSKQMWKWSLNEKDTPQSMYLNAGFETSSRQSVTINNYYYYYYYCHLFHYWILPYPNKICDPPKRKSPVKSTNGGPYRGICKIFQDAFKCYCRLNSL